MKTVFVDVWDTLVANPNTNPVQEIRERYFADRAYDEVRNAIMDSDLFTKEIDSTTAWAKILNTLQENPSSELVLACKDIWDTSNSKAKLIPGALLFLDELKKHTDKVILATAIDKESFSMLDEKFHLQEHVDTIAPSFTIGTTKSEAYYHELSKRFHVQPHNAVMIGDSVDRDAIPATNAGWHTALLRHAPLNKELSRLVPKQTTVCSSYKDILYAISHNKI